MKDPIVHFELPADDVERAQKFYKDIFGWDFHKWDMPAIAQLVESHITVFTLLKPMKTIWLKSQA